MEESVKYRVLVVDDDVANLQALRAILKKQGMQVNVVRSGKECLRFMEKNKTDIVLLDIRMPQMDGFTVFNKIRRYEEEHSLIKTPVIFLTAADGNSTEVRGLKMGAADFLHKPVNKSILIHRINNAIESARMVHGLEEEAMIDGLTGLLNKSASERKLRDICTFEEGILMILDLDSFKLVNDIYGHDIGDKVLIAFADAVKKNG